MKKFTNMMKVLNQINYEEVKTQDFQKKDFIKLRQINGNEKRLIFLAIHIKSLRIYMMKIPSNQDSKEADFCQNFSHRCCRKFYGFLKEKEKNIGFIYEFMSNGTLSDFMKKQPIDSAYILMTIMRLFQGIDYFHSNSLIHRDLKPTNILIDNNYIPYISDFDVIRQLVSGPMTGDIGSSLYTSPEQDAGENISFSSDIYSFGLIIYYLYEKKDLVNRWKKENEQIPLISKASKNIQEIYQSCLQFSPEKRMEREKIKSILFDEIKKLSYLEDYYAQKPNAVKTMLVIQYFIESIFIQIDNGEIINEYYDYLFYFYAPFYFKEIGKYGDVFLTIGEIYSQGKIVKKDNSKALKYYELSAKYNNSIALLYLGIKYENGTEVNQDYLKAKEYYELSAKLQNSNALLNLGILYEKGLGVKQDYIKAREYYEKSAQLGNSRALFDLGTLYSKGKGVQQDYLKAKEYYEKSAEKNDKHALFNLGDLYLKGLGVEQDYLKAIEYFESSAKLNNLDANLNLGIMYENGSGVKKDYQKAKEYYEYCAEQNNAHAFYNLGNLYYNGFGVEKDYLTAFNYFELSAKGNYYNALFNLGVHYEKGHGVKQDYQKAKEYYELSAEKGNAAAFYKLGKMFQYGLGVKQDYKKAKEYYELSAKEKDSNALFNLGVLCINGSGVEKDYLKGKEFLEMSAKLNNEMALLNLGNIYSEGLGVEKNYFKAKEYFELSAKQGNSSALLNLGALYEKGHGVMQNYSKAKEYYELSSSKGNLKATINLGSLYEKGHGVKQDYLKAKEYYEIAAEQNDPNAFVNLGNLYSKGLGVEQNYLKAIEYYKMSAKQNDTMALIALGYHYEKGLGVEKNESIAMDYYGYAGKLGNSSGYTNLGFIYSEKHEYTKAIKYYELAAEQNNSIALLNLGYLYEHGKGVKQDYSKAMEYYELSAKQNYSTAFLYLGTFYEYGYAVERNYLKAKEYYKIAAQLNNSEANVCLGLLYEKGLGVKQDILKAKDLYELSGKQNDAIALYFLGNLFSSGEFSNIDIDLQKAENYFLRCFNINNNQFITFSPAESVNTVSTLYNFYRYISYNDLGLLYLTILQDNEKAFNYIKESAFSEYPFAQNNAGLYYQIYLNHIGNAEHMYKRSSEHAFALAEFNLGIINEKENKIQESVDYFIKASKHENQPLLYKDHHHYDKRLEISKTFILCFTNLKLAIHFLTDSKFEESKKYFVKSFAKLNLTNEKITYKFSFHFNKRKTRNIFSYFLSFILLHPLFNLKNHPYSKITNYINDLHLDSEDKSKLENRQPITNIETQSEEIEKIKEFEINNLNKSKFDFIFKNEFENSEPTNIDPDNDEEEIIFNDPGELFDFIIKNEELKKSFIDEIKEILRIIKEILYIPPYPILFGRIFIQKPKQKPVKKIYPFMKNINNFFYEGLGTI